MTTEVKTEEYNLSENIKKQAENTVLGRNLADVELMMVDLYNKEMEWSRDNEHQVIPYDVWKRVVVHRVKMYTQEVLGVVYEDE